MEPDRKEQIASLARHLETDLLLGVRAVPLALTQKPAGAFGRNSPQAARPGQSPANRTTQVGAFPRVTSTAAVAARTLAAGAPPVATSSPAPKVQNLPPEEIKRREEMLREIEAQVRKCRKCGLAETRTKTVFGQGSPAARLVFVGEAPGHDEDQQGLAFVGRAGQLLTKMIDAMGLTRDQVFICNILKCRPPNNRDPAPDEVSNCWPFLDQQLRVIQPEVIVALGKPASQTLLRTTESIGRLRGHWHDYYISGAPGMGEPTPLMPTFHPAYLLRSPNEKGKAWADLQMVMAKLGLPLPKKPTS